MTSPPTQESRKVKRGADCLTRQGFSCARIDVLYGSFIRFSIPCVVCMHNLKPEKCARKHCMHAPSLSNAEEEFWHRVYTFFINRYIQSSKQWFPEKLTAEPSAEIFRWTEEGVEKDLEHHKMKEYYGALRLVRKARKDRQYWDELYQKFKEYWDWCKKAPTDKWGRITQ